MYLIMKQSILNYFISIILCCPINLFSQGVFEPSAGIRMGMDLSRFMLFITDEYRSEFEINVDMNITRNYYLVSELGYGGVKMEDSLYNYKSSGYYYTVGIDKNFYKHDNDMFYLGLRFAQTRQKFNVSDILIQNALFSADDVYMSEPYNYTQKPVFTSYIKLVIGVKTEVLKNIFMGLSFDANFVVDSNHKRMVDPYVIAGFGRYKRNNSIGFNYSIYYRIPYKKYSVAKVVNE